MLKTNTFGLSSRKIQKAWKTAKRTWDKSHEAKAVHLLKRHRERYAAALAAREAV